MYAYPHTKRKSIRVWTYRPKDWVENDQIVFVMHGGGRNAENYLDAWIELADQNNLFIVAPEFENKFSKYTTNDYQEGNLFTFFGTKNPRSEWAYAIIENIFDHIKSANSFSNDSYDIFGHSAGGQFVHRMLMLYPEARIGTAIAANAGFYTLPDENLRYPYGLKKTEIGGEGGLKEAYEKRLVILLAELDNDPSLGTFRTTESAMDQGSHRLERGSNFYAQNLQFTSKNDWTFNWQIDSVKNVGHNFSEMSKHAVEWLKQ